MAHLRTLRSAVSAVLRFFIYNIAQRLSIGVLMMTYSETCHTT